MYTKEKEKLRSWQEGLITTKAGQRFERTSFL